jgi:hypothetical protein
MTRQTSRPGPAEVVLAAYAAANRGHYSRANVFLAPSARRELVEAQALVAATGRKLRRTLVQLRGKRGEVAARDRGTIRVLIRSNKALASMQVGSTRFFIGLWKAATRERSLVAVKATRQVIRGGRARVYLRLSLRDGTVVRDSEPLVFHRGKWLLG